MITDLNLNSLSVFRTDVETTIAAPLILFASGWLRVDISGAAITMVNDNLLCQSLVKTKTTNAMAITVPATGGPVATRWRS